MSLRRSRRSFLHRACRVLGAVAVGGALAGCGGKGGERSLQRIAEQKKQYDPDLDCSDTGGLWPAEVATRTDNEYTSSSPREDQFCFNCENFQPPETEGRCAACTTVKGPIHPLGWCKSWTQTRG